MCLFLFGVGCMGMCVHACKLVLTSNDDEDDIVSVSSLDMLVSLGFVGGFVLFVVFVLLMFVLSVVLLVEGPNVSPLPASPHLLCRGGMVFPRVHHGCRHLKGRALQSFHF